MLVSGQQVNTVIKVCMSYVTELCTKMSLAGWMVSNLASQC